jgi:hypothetical protein
MEDLVIFVNMKEKSAGCNFWEKNVSFLEVIYIHWILLCD